MDYFTKNGTPRNLVAKEIVGALADALAGFYIKHSVRHPNIDTVDFNLFTNDVAFRLCARIGMNYDKFIFMINEARRVRRIENKNGEV